MCVVLDTNVFGDFFDSKNKNHIEYKPVFNWVVKGKGKLVYGGKKYKSEMLKVTKYLRFFVALEKAGKIVKLRDENVDSLQEKIRAVEPNEKFDDPHLIAIILESKCQIICTNDKRAIPYIKDKKFYPKSVKRPKLYTSSKNSNLLVDANISDICKPYNKLTREGVENLVPALEL